MKIVYLATEMQQGGGETVARVLLNGWRSRGHDVSLVLTYQPGKLARLIEAEDRISVVGLNLPRGSRLAWGLPRLFVLFRRIRPDVVILNNSAVLLPWAWALKFVTGGPVFAAVHDTVKQPTLRERLSHRFLGLYAKVISIAEPHAQYCKRAFELDDHQLRVIHNGIECDNHLVGDMPIAIQRLPSSAIVGVICARLFITKDHATLIRAVRQVVDKRPDFHLAIIGDGPERQNIESLVTDLGLDGHVHLLGWVHDSEKAAVIKRAQVGLLSSRDVETLPISVLEYMRAGIPVISTRIGSVEAQIVDGSTGYLVPQGDVDAMAKAILGLAGQPAERQRLGDAGRRRQAMEFSVAGMVDGYLKLFVEYVRASAQS